MTAEKPRSLFGQLFADLKTIKRGVALLAFFGVGVASAILWASTLAKKDVVERVAQEITSVKEDRAARWGALSVKIDALCSDVSEIKNRQEEDRKERREDMSRLWGAIRGRGR